MQRILLRSKIHRVRVTGADLDYEGSCSIDADLLDRAQIAPFEKVEIYDISNGHRLETYAIVGPRGSGEVQVNGAAARLIHENDLVIICCYGVYSEQELAGHAARIVHVDARNRPVESPREAVGADGGRTSGRG